MEGQSIEIKIKKKPSHRKRFSRGGFNQVMLNDKTRSILDIIKSLMPEKECKNHNIDYGELKSILYSLKKQLSKNDNEDSIISFNNVIIFLVKQFLKKDIEYKIKSYSYEFPTKKVSSTYATKTKSRSYSFEN